jgi:hypothetical protein
VMLHERPPARLIPAFPTPEDGIVVNTTRPVKLEMRAFDERGRPVASEGVSYRYVSGAPIALSPQGVLTCSERGDVTVHASLGRASGDFTVQCRPVYSIRSATWIDFVTGDPRRDLPFIALDTDERPVMQLRGSAHVADSSIALLEGTTIKPRAPGMTFVSVEVGERKADMAVIVHELVPSFVGLRPDQRFVAMPVRLSQGDTVRWNLPKGAFWIKYMSRGEAQAPPTIELFGDGLCTNGEGGKAYRMPLGEHGKYCYVWKSGALAMVAHGVTGAAVVEGVLMLERIEVPREP